jgi:hypothetical protein
MEIEILKDTNKRMCAICHKRIIKGQTLVKHPVVINDFHDTRLWFAHLNCTIRKLIAIRKEIKQRLSVVPKISINIGRHKPKEAGGKS